MRRPCFALSAVAGLVLGTTMANAQELRGTVMNADGTTPAGGVVAVLLHPTRDDSIIARAVSNERGRFALKAPPVTGGRLRLLRIGYEPMLVGAITLAAGQVRNVSYTLSGIRIQLAAVDVKATSRCEVRPDGAKLVAQLFLQARTALIASTTPIVGSASAAQFASYRRSQDRRGALIAPLRRVMQSGATLRPFASLDVDSLAKVGYVVADGAEVTDGATYYAPDANVLLSDTFLAGHCLQLVQGKDSLAGSIGIGFRPVANRGQKVDVRGTFWLDRATSELQYLEFEYDGLPGVMRDAGLGGRVDYARLSNGSWFVSSWSLRMPVLQALNGAQSSALSYLAPANRIIMNGQTIEGGEVQRISVDDQVLYLNMEAERAGQRPQDREAADLELAIKSADAATEAEALCTGQLSFQHTGRAIGRVLNETRQGVRGVDVKAEWKEQFTLVNETYKWTNNSIRTATDVDGIYRLCGLSTEHPVTISAFHARAWTRASTLRLTEQSPRATLDIQVGSERLQK